jgi:hypothetical protein
LHARRFSPKERQIGLQRPKLAQAFGGSEMKHKAHKVHEELYTQLAASLCPSCPWCLSLLSVPPRPCVSIPLHRALLSRFAAPTMLSPSGWCSAHFLPRTRRGTRPIAVMHNVHNHAPVFLPQVKTNKSLSTNRALQKKALHMHNRSQPAPRASRQLTSQPLLSVVQPKSFLPRFGTAHAKLDLPRCRCRASQ